MKLDGIPYSRGFDNETIRAAFSSVSLPGILSNVANKKLLQSYEAQPVIATKLCSTGDLNDFKENRINVLVSTTVIEVGVNVPTATTMVISNAERFGLASLHQLRGRVGRSDLQAFCVLDSEDTSEKAIARLSIMCNSTDGFVIAQEDMKLRGAGDFLGTAQSGDNKYMALMLAYPEKYEQAKTIAIRMLDSGMNCRMMEQVMEERTNMDSVTSM